MTQTLSNYALPAHKALVLRCCAPSMTSYDDFVWPEAGYVSCPDWDPKPVCGKGLHGWLWGEGQSASCIFDLHSPSIRWLVVEVLKDSVVDLGGKVKFPSGFVVYCGDKQGALDLLVSLRGADRPIIGHAVTTGDSGTAVAGDYGKAVSGESGVAVAGRSGTAVTGGLGHSAAGPAGTAVSGMGGLAVVGFGGEATVGRFGRAEAGSRGKAVAGAYGVVVAGEGGVAEAGDNGRAETGYLGTASAGDGGVVMFARYSFDPDPVVGRIGRDGLLPNFRYRLDSNHSIVPA